MASLTASSRNLAQKQCPHIASMTFESAKVPDHLPERALLLGKEELAAAAAAAVEHASLRQLMCVKRAVSLAVHAAARTKLAMDPHDSPSSSGKTHFASDERSHN